MFIHVCTYNRKHVHTYERRPIFININISVCTFIRLALYIRRLPTNIRKYVIR